MWRMSVRPVCCQVYFDLQSSKIQASIRLTGHSLVPVPGSGMNYALLGSDDLHILESGVFSAGDAALNTALTNVPDGTWLMIAVAVDASNMNTQTVTTLTSNFGASGGVGSLENGQGYVLVSQKGAGSNTLEQDRKSTRLNSSH